MKASDIKIGGEYLFRQNIERQTHRDVANNSGMKVTVLATGVAYKEARAKAAIDSGNGDINVINKTSHGHGYLMDRSRGKGTLVRTEAHYNLPKYDPLHPDQIADPVITEDTGYLLVDNRNLLAPFESWLAETREAVTSHRHRRWQERKAADDRAAKVEELNDELVVMTEDVFTAVAQGGTIGIRVNMDAERFVEWVRQNLRVDVEHG